MSKIFAALALSLSLMCGCETVREIREAIRVSEVEFCVEYKGRKVCFGRVSGVWKFSADLSSEERGELLKKVGESE